MKHTGRLEGWYKDPHFNIIWGRIYGDIYGRFPDGTRIHTSSLSPTKQVLEEGLTITTLNSFYKLGKPL